MYRQCVDCAFQYMNETRLECAVSCQEAPTYQRCFSARKLAVCDSWISETGCGDTNCAHVQSQTCLRYNCAINQVFESGKCAQYQRQSYMVTADGQKCACTVGNVFGFQCLPARCGVGRVWIRNGCYDEKWCKRSVEGYCFLELVKNDGEWD